MLGMTDNTRHCSAFQENLKAYQNGAHWGRRFCGALSIKHLSSLLVCYYQLAIPRGKPQDKEREEE